MTLLGSSVLIELFRKKNKEKTFFYELAKSENIFSISSVTHYEFGIGDRSIEHDYWNELYESLIVIPFDKLCSQTAIGIYLVLKKQNRLIDLADLLIGATAVTYNYRIATLNRKHSERIPGIHLADNEATDN